LRTAYCDLSQGYHLFYKFVLAKDLNLYIAYMLQNDKFINDSAAPSTAKEENLESDSNLALLF
jgi:hypothetical protein